MASQNSSTTRRYTPEFKERAVRLVMQLREEIGQEHGTIQRIAEQLGCGVESLRTWVKQSDVDAGVKPGVTTSEAKRIWRRRRQRCDAR